MFYKLVDSERVSMGRPHLGNRAGFVLFLVSAQLSHYSIWKFSVLCINYGVLATLVPYLIQMLMLGLPLVHLELSLGQFMQRTGPKSWDVVPLLKGVSVSSMLLALTKVATHLMHATWCGYSLYLFATVQLPRCSGQAENDLISNWTMADMEGENIESQDLPEVRQRTSTENTAGLYRLSQTSPEFEPNQTCEAIWLTFWREEILQSSPDITTPGGAVVPVFISLVAATVTCFLCGARGLRLLTWILAFAVPLCVAGFVATAVLAARGADSNVSLLLNTLYPSFESLTKIELWTGATSAVLHTLGLGLNLLPCLGSYHRGKSDISRNTLVCCVTVVLVNVLAAMCVAVLFGDTEVDKALLFSNQRDPSFLLVSIPALLSSAPSSETSLSLSPSLSLNRSETPRLVHTTIGPGALPVLLYLASLLLVALTGVLVYVESLVSALCDLSSKLWRWRLLVLLGVVAAVFLLDLAMCMEGGIFIFEVLDQLTDSTVVVGTVCFLQCAGIGFIYGGSRLYDNIEMMTGTAPHRWMRFAWVTVCPLSLVALTAYEVYLYPNSPLSLDWNPPLDQLGQLLTLSTISAVLAPVPVIAAWQVWRQPGRCFKKVKSAMRPHLHPGQIPIRWRLEGRWHRFADRL